MALSPNELSRIREEERERAHAREQYAIHRQRKLDEADEAEMKRLAYVERHGGPQAAARHTLKKWAVGSFFYGIAMFFYLLFDDGFLAGLQGMVTSWVMGGLIGLYRAKKVSD